MPVTVLLNLFTCACAGLAAWFWWKAATASVRPEQAAVAEGLKTALSKDPRAGDWVADSIDMEDDKGRAYALSDTLALQGRWNTRAAAAACAAAAGQALVYMDGLITALSAA